MGSAPPPTAGQLARFSAVAVPLAAAGLPLGVYLPAIYARDYGLSLTVIGVIFLLGRLWDAVADPVMGSLSDRTRSRYGRRKPWIAAGGVVFGLSSIFLFFPPFGVTPLSLGIILFFFYLGWTAVQIPFQAWSGEVSGDYHQRTRIATYQTVVTSGALLLTLILPTIADQLRPGDGHLQLSLMGGLVLLSIVPALVLTLTALREPPLPPLPVGKPSLKETIRAITGEPLLLRVLASDFAVTLAQNIRAALIVFFVTFYMGRPEWAGGLFLFQFVFGIFAGPIWLKIGRRYGKHRTAVAGELVQVAINLSLLLVTPDAFGLLLALTLAQGLAQGSGNLMLRAIVADVADKHRLDSGEDRTGLYYSVFSLAGKTATAVAVGIALPLVSWLGFDPKAVNSPEALTGLLLVFAAGPAIAHAFSAALIARFPLDEAAHAEIRRQLDPGPPDYAFAE
ncbi:MFS transporter [Sphingopyxis sp.]|uniref:MFS transporter n=1 Tax=Sphingopyxis sp. TaxID=1908224 RepID=UPI002B49B523|nr:MFS transporter [Sphingopyxis sp.]HJS11378.1 MFS transporter [Sphingopyxis sp.]